eukprot:TRINITY_DN41417_c0_g1_i1.p1 TRINITY_DN41417_c0_g1~~TRINITY_DN41417_c0_g1_i1.p1  ORF type:complete len:130 (-),score=12.12 TRINITY_DN41417_c0_g1_i1:44-433(-)
MLRSLVGSEMCIRDSLDVAVATRKCFAICDRDLVIVGMDFAEGEETMAVSAVIDESRLQGRFYTRHFREIDIPYSALIPCLLYTSDAADEEDSVDLAGRRTINNITLLPLFLFPLSPLIISIIDTIPSH